MKLKNKVILITGGRTGIGPACTKLFTNEVARVVIFGRRKGTLGATTPLLLQG